MYVDLQLHQGRSLDTVTQADLLGSWGAVLAGDYGRHTAAAVMLETAERLTARSASRRCGCSCCWSAGCAPSRPG